MKLPLSRIAEHLGVQANDLGAAFNRDAVAAGYSIDSRTVRPGEVFFAVRGERMDGHEFIEQALDKGAIAAVVSKERLDSISSHVTRDAAVRGGRALAS